MSQKLKIDLVSEHASPLADPGGPDAGGQNVHVGELATALVAQGHDVTVWTRRDRPRQPVCTHHRRGRTGSTPRRGPTSARGARTSWGRYLPALADGL